jgi:Uma2 family endonuclease
MSVATYKLSIDEYDRMIATGVFDEDARIELIEGELHEMSPPGPTHEHLIDLLLEWSFPLGAKHGFKLRIQNSIGLPEKTSAPQPDVAWVRNRSYRQRRPQTKDVLLVIEVADSSLSFDRRTKGAIYAEAGIPEYWIVNCEEESIEVYREPKKDGYSSLQTFGVGESVAPLAAPEGSLAVGWIFGHE